MSADSAGEALRLIGSKPELDLILIDFAMPEMNGADLARHIGKMRPTLPVILTTGYDKIDALADFGFAQVLQKPWTDAELNETIKLALGRYRPAQ
jgi:CheY-like chemotaxis protein